MKSYLPLDKAVRPTTIVHAPLIGEPFGVELTLASETYQHTGSFKFRAAYNVVSKISQDYLIAASSGNFGQAIAYACKILGKRCTIVMPQNSAKIKIDAVKRYGGEIDLVNTKEKSRAQRVKELAETNSDAYIASAYDDPLVIEGNASLGKELGKLGFHYVIVPIGGGGLTSGIIKGLRECASSTKVIAAEPLLANDAARSLRAGHIIHNEHEPQTIADGARTLSVGKNNWAILKDSLFDIIEVPEDAIKQGMKRLFFDANLKAEPTGALSVAALILRHDLFWGYKVCCVISGGNVDPDLYKSIIES